MMFMDMDLNLLRVFDTLMELRSVTRAADRIGVTQSAVSHALGRLRHALDDPLFVRGAQGLQPTPRASEMAPGVREGLRQINQTLSHPQS
jgi:DNA-binding transcriptional LysR family regulator